MRTLGFLILLGLSPLLAQDAASINASSFMADGDAAAKQNKWHDAEIAYQKAVEANPQSAEAHSKLADAIGLQAFPNGIAAAGANVTELRRVLKEREAASELAPADAKLLSNLAQAEAAISHFSSDKDEQATSREKAFADERKLLELTHGNPAVRFTLANMELFYINQVMSSSPRGSSADPDSPRILDDAVRRRLVQQIGPTLDDALLQLKETVQAQTLNQAAKVTLDHAYWLKAGLEDSDSAATRDLASGVKALFGQANSTLYNPTVVVASNPNNPRGVIGGVAGGVPPPPPPPPPKPQPPFGPQRVGGTVMEANLLKKVQPAYPPLAKTARIQGTVEFVANISKEGRVTELQLVRGHPLLVNAAKEAVLQWEYRPTILNGNPVEVLTEVIVSFTLTQ